MPFTVSHIAAVLPFKKLTPSPLSFTGLIIGSMVPDFEYFIRMTLYGHYGHTIAGIFIFDLPVGLLLYVLYHGTVRVQLIRHLPQIFYTRFAVFIDSNWKSYFRRHFLQLVLSLFIGTLTHFIWDGLTHDQEYILARYIPVLLVKVTIAGLSLPLHFWLQILSSFAGMLIVLIFLYKMPAGAEKQPLSSTRITRYWVGVGITTVVIGVVRWLASVPNEKIAGQLVVISMSAFMLALILISLFYTIVKPD